jgi:hypothetical protein
LLPRLFYSAKAKFTSVENRKKTKEKRAKKPLKADKKRAKKSVALPRKKEGKRAKKKTENDYKNTSKKHRQKPSKAGEKSVCEIGFVNMYFYLLLVFYRVLLVFIHF